MDEIHHPVTTGLVSPPAATLGTARSGREAAQGSSLPPDQNHELRPPNDPSPGAPGEVLEGSRLQEKEEKDEEEDDEEEEKDEEEEDDEQEEEEEEEEESAHGHNHSPDPLLLPQEEPEPDRELNVMEPLSDHRWNRKNFLFIPGPGQVDPGGSAV